MKTLTIYYFCFEGFKKIGRLNNHVTETVNRLSKIGNQVYFFNPNIITPDLDKGVNQKLIPIINKPILKWISFDFLSFFTMLFNALTHPPDVIYYRESSSLAPLLIAKLFSRPMLIEINGWVLDELSAIDYPNYKLKLIKLIQTINYKNADRLISVSNGLKKSIIKNYNIDPNKISVVNNGTNPEIYHPIETTIAREKIDLDQTKKIIGFIGGCYPHHGIQYLIEAAPILIENYPDILFVVAGDGIMLESWKNLAHQLSIHDHFYFPGNVPYDLAPFYINSFDICVAPWDKDLIGKIGLSPMKLFDYLACARPVIAASVNGIDDIVRANDIGTTIDVKDPVKFANTIINIYDNMERYKKKAARGYEFVTNKYTWQKTTEKLYYIMVKETHDTSTIQNNSK